MECPQYVHNAGYLKRLQLAPAFYNILFLLSVVCK